MDEDLIGQNDIEQMLRSAGEDADAAVAGGMDAKAGDTAGKRASDAARADVGDDIQYLLDQAEDAIASANKPLNDAESAGAVQYRLNDFAGSQLSDEKATLDLLRDVELDLKIELGRADMYLEDVLKLRKGSVVALDKLAGDPVDVYVNGRLIARGEVLVLNDNFCVRVAELIAGDES